MRASNENWPFHSGQSDRHRIQVQLVVVGVAVVLVDSSLVGLRRTVAVVEGHHRRPRHSDCSTVATVFVVGANEIA